MRKRIVNLGELDEMGCAGDHLGDADLDELGDAELEGDELVRMGDADELAAVGGCGGDCITREDCAVALGNGSQAGFILGAFVGGLLGVGLGAAGGAFVASRYTVGKR